LPGESFAKWRIVLIGAVGEHLSKEEALEFMQNSRDDNFQCDVFLRDRT
jgi:hypothetical protein